MIEEFEPSDPTSTATQPPPTEALPSDGDDGIGQEIHQLTSLVYMDQYFAPKDIAAFHIVLRHQFQERTKEASKPRTTSRLSILY